MKILEMINFLSEDNYDDNWGDDFHYVVRFTEEYYDKNLDILRDKHDNCNSDLFDAIEKEIMDAMNIEIDQIKYLILSPSRYAIITIHICDFVF